MKHVSPLLVLFFTLLVAGCNLVPETQEVVLYQLPETRLTKAPGALDITLKVGTIESNDAFNGRRLLVTENGAALNALPGARWSSSVRNLLQDRLVESFRADGRIAYITSDAGSLRSDYELHSTLRNFVGDYSTQPTAYIRLDAILTDPSSRRIVAAHEFRVSVPSSSKSANDLVAAFAESTDRLATEIVNWIDSSLSK